MTDDNKELTTLGETNNAHAKHAIILCMIEHMYDVDKERDRIAISSDLEAPENMAEECVAAGWPSERQMEAIGATLADVGQGWVDLFDRIRVAAKLERIPYLIEEF